jgi:two-component system, sensor histidine kinase
VRAATQLLLRVEGYEVTPAASLAESLAVLASRPPVEVVVADYHLAHGETGLEVISSLREIYGTDLRAVLMTGDTSSAMLDLPGDFDVRLAKKPLRADELLTFLAEPLASAADRR